MILFLNGDLQTEAFTVHLLQNIVQAGFYWDNQKTNLWFLSVDK